VLVEPAAVWHDCCHRQHSLRVFSGDCRRSAHN